MIDHYADFALACAIAAALSTLGVAVMIIGAWQ